MPSPLLFKNATIQYSFGSTPQSGATPVPADPTTNDMACRVRNLRVNISSSTVDLSTVCSSTVENFSTRLTGTIEFDFVTDKTDGPIWQPKQDYLTKIKITAGSTTVFTRIYGGLVSNVSVDHQPGEVYTESVTIDLGAYGFNSVFV